MALRLDGIGIGSIALLALVACSESDTTPGGGTSGTTSAGSGGTPGASGSSSGSTSGGAGGSGGDSAAGAMSAGTGGMSGGAGGTGATGGSGGESAGSGGGSGGAKSKTTFFVTSDTSKTGNLGGLTGADARCNTLAKAAGFGDHTFKAYLSTSTENAKDRIGTGPWFNSMGVMLAADVNALHSITGDADLFLDEKGMKINGQWNGGNPNEHDILTGSKADGTTSGKTCMDWTSDSANDSKTVGHSDGMGPGMATTGTYSSWNASHDTNGCDNTAPGGGAGRIYCFAID